MTTLRSLTLIMPLLAIGQGCDRGQAPQPAKVTIGGTSWTVEIAATEDQRYQGLSDRPSLAPSTGMLFVFPNAQELTFCMRRCLIPLDIAFIGPDMKVVRTDTMKVEPYGREVLVYSSYLPAQYVLEVNAGGLKRAGVKMGDSVVFSGPAPSPAKGEAAP